MYLKTPLKQIIKRLKELLIVILMLERWGKRKERMMKEILVRVVKIISKELDLI